MSADKLATSRVVSLRDEWKLGFYRVSAWQRQASADSLHSPVTCPISNDKNPIHFEGLLFGKQPFSLKVDDNDNSNIHGWFCYCDAAAEPFKFVYCVDNECYLYSGESKNNDTLHNFANC